MRHGILISALAAALAHVPKPEAGAVRLELEPPVVKAPKKHSFAEQRLSDKQRKLKGRTRR